VNINLLKKAWLLPCAALFVLLLIAASAYHETFSYLLRTWGQLYGDYGHGYLVLLISLGLIYQNRRRLLVLTPCSDYRALPLVGLVSILWMLASVVDVQVVQAVSLLLLVVFVIWALLGAQLIKQLAFPLLFLIFAIPVWFPLSPILQEITADAVFWMVRVLHVPAFRQENLIMLPLGKLSIEEACSGLRYLLAALTLGVLYAYVNYKSLSARLVVIAVSVVSAILANIIRVFIVVYLAYKTDMQHPLIEDHYTMGWMLFGGLMGLLFMLDIKLHRLFSVKQKDEISVDTPTAGNGQRKQTRLPLVTVIAAILLLVGPVGVYWLGNQPASGDGRAGDIGLPLKIGEWELQPTSDDWMPVFHGAEAQKKGYRKGSDIAYIYVGYYSAQSQGKELISEMNNISGASNWRAVYLNERVYHAGGQKILEQTLESNFGRKRLVWYWYNVAGKTTTDKYFAKLLQILGLVKGRQEAFVVALAMDQVNDAKPARIALRDLVAELRLEIN